jgi:formylmethanofuran dehydrogenase subunit E
VVGGKDFETLLEESVRVHGHLCPGQVLGVRMSILGLRAVGIEDPRKDLMVFVEMDRCATDAVQSVTGCSLGRRTLRFMDFGKMAATFLNLRTGRAVRVLAREEAREGAESLFPGAGDRRGAQVRAYKAMADEELFDTMRVEVAPRPEDMSGRPRRKVRCGECGECVQDSREVYREGRALCRSCAGGGYYKTDGRGK